MWRIVLLLILIPALAYAQDINYLGRPETEKLPEKYQLDPNALRDRIFYGLPPQLRGDIKTDRRCLIFAQEQAVVISSMISSGTLYSDWPELEDYVNRILKRVMPSELKNDTAIHVYIFRDGSNNAFMLPSGHILMSIGFIAEASSESMIAAVLAHELAHFYKQHSIYSYLQSLKSSYGQWYYYRSGKFKKYSLNAETEADTIAMNWMIQTGYNLDGMKAFFESDSLANQNEIARSKDLWEIEEVTHPLSESRLKAVRDFLNRYPGHSGESFIEDEQQFYQFRKEARIESLKCLMQSMGYYDCIERAFKYHIFEPGNAGYIYYILESIRRQCYLNRNLWNENFITNRYYRRDSTSSKPIKKRYDENIFKTYNPGLLSITTSDTSQIITKRYWNGPPDFTTYEQAFVYFYSISQFQQMHEAILSNALSVSHIKTSRNKLLSEYLKKDNIRYRDFAEALLKDSLYAGLDTSRIMVLMEFNTYLKMNKEHLLIIRQPSDTADHISEIMNKTVSEFAGWKAFLLSDITKNNTYDSRMLTTLFHFSRIPTVSVGGQLELALIDPSYWNEFMKYGVNRIEFLIANYADPTLVGRNSDNYRSLIEKGNTLLFYPPQRKRFMQLELTGLTMAPEGQMKKRYRYSTHFGNRMVSVPEIAKELADQLIAKDKQKTGDYYLFFKE